MVKKKGDFVGFSTWEPRDYVRECPNLVRWNPRLAIEWMNSVRYDMMSDVMIAAYNDAAQRINKFLDELETYRYYNKYETWDNDRPTRLELIKMEF